MDRWDPELREAERLEQFKLIYDYIKFHMGLYLATPPLIAIVAESTSVSGSCYFLYGLGAMILVYFISGAHAGWFMGSHVNTPWKKEFLVTSEAKMFSLTRRVLHHWFYWLGLLLGLAGLAAAIAVK